MGLLSAEYFHVKARSIPDCLAPNKNEENETRLRTVDEERRGGEHADDGIDCR